MAATVRENRYVLTAEDRTKQAFDQLSRRFNETQRTLNLIRNLTAGAFSVAGLTAFVNKVAEAERQQNRLTAVINAQGHAAGFTRQQLDLMADALARATEFDDEAFASAQAELIKFGDVYGEVFERALKLSADLASFQGTDLLSATQLVARALQSPLNSLKGFEQQFGKLDEAQKASLRSAVEQNRTLDAQNQLLDILQGKIGGTAALMNTGYNGAIKSVTESWDDLLEALGKTDIVQGTVQSFLRFLHQSFTDIKTIIETGDWWNGLLFLLGGRGAPDSGQQIEQRIASYRQQIAALQKLIDSSGVSATVKEGAQRQLRDVQALIAAQEEVLRQLRRSQTGGGGLAPPPVRGEEQIVSLKQVLIPAPPSPQTGPNVLGLDVGFFNQQFRQAAGLSDDERLNLLGLGPEYFAALEKEQAFAAEDLRVIHERQQAQLRLGEAVGDYLKFIELETRLMSGTLRDRQRVIDDLALESIGLKEGTEEWIRYSAAVEQARDQQEKLRGSFSLGVQRAFDDYLDTVANVAASSENLFSNAFKGMEDALVEFVLTGKLSFSDLADQIIRDLIRMQIQASITGPLFNFLQTVPLFTGRPGTTTVGTPVGFKHGGSFVVGGSGGADSQHVGFYATPGELVTVQTPAQQRESGSTFLIDARGADSAGLRRLEAVIRELNGSIEYRAVAAVADAQQRGGSFARQFRR